MRRSCSPLLALLVVALQIAGAFGEASPHDRPNSKEQLKVRLGDLASSGRRLEGGNPTLTVSTRVLTGTSGGVVNVTWSDIEFAKGSDWIGVWDASVDLKIFSSPVKFHYVMPDPSRCRDHKDQGECNADPACAWDPKFDDCGAGIPPSTGTIAVTVPNLRSNMVFYYISGSIQYPSPLCYSPAVSFATPNIPQGVHLALGENRSSMRVYWTAGAVAEPSVRVSESPGGAGHVVSVAGQYDAGRQYTKDDMCDVEAGQPAGRQGWYAPGKLLSATLVDLKAGMRYYYSVGDSATGWSEEHSFRAPPALDPTRKTVVAAFGDMGQVEPDGASHHSWDFENKGELPSLNTTRQLVAEGDELDIVLHIGDISYACGYLSEWDNFFNQVEPVASQRPWQTAIGNHEQGYHKSSPFPGTDSGGECGVPYNAHFPFASQDPGSTTNFSTREPWYSFEYGNAAFVVMSTEHDFSPGSAQHTALRAALAAVDRSRTPWLVFSGHRPMYVGSPWPGDASSAEEIRKGVEPLLVEFAVDVALWGHFHAYERFCPGLVNGTCGATGGKGVQHFVIGMAGYDHSDCPPKGNATTLPMLKCNDQDWGFMRMTFETSSATFEFVGGDAGKVLDTTVLPARKNYM